MSWFGWLTKGRMDVSLLDGFVLIGEVILAVFVLVTLQSYYEWFKGLFKKQSSQETKP